MGTVCSSSCSRPKDDGALTISAPESKLTQGVSEEFTSNDPFADHPEDRTQSDRVAGIIQSQEEQKYAEGFTAAARDDREAEKGSLRPEAEEECRRHEADEERRRLEAEADRQRRESEEAARLEEEVQERLQAQKQRSDEIQAQQTAQLKLEQDMKAERYEEWQRMLAEQRTKMKADENIKVTGKRYSAEMEDPTMGIPPPLSNRFGVDAQLPEFDRAKHIPLIALINPLSGSKCGRDILQISSRMPYYQDRFFDIIQVVKGRYRGGLMDVFRIELEAAKEEARAMGVRPRLISGGGDGTASFALFIAFQALQADPTREDEGLKDMGNGFIWNDQDMEDFFPALAQMPCGSANDFANILGWGQKHPGDPGHAPACLKGPPLPKLQAWISHCIDPKTQVVNFDVWGLMPRPGQDNVEFKIADLSGPKGVCPKVKIDGKNQLVMKTASLPVPFFVCLYFSIGYGAYMVARFAINRRSTPIRNRLEYIRQGVAIVFEPTPPQTRKNCGGVTIDCEDKPYFPPRREAKGTKGSSYWEVGCYNINWQAHLLHGADRASLPARLRYNLGCGGSRSGVRFNDGLLDMYRMRFTTHMKNPGLIMQTDKRHDMNMNYEASEGQGIFFQYDGEARFAFSPTGQAFSMCLQQVMNIPVVIGPKVDQKLTGRFNSDVPVKFRFGGDSDEERQRFKNRLFRLLSGELNSEMVATEEDIRGAKLRSESEWLKSRS